MLTCAFERRSNALLIGTGEVPAGDLTTWTSRQQLGLSDFRSIGQCLEQFESETVFGKTGGKQVDLQCSSEHMPGLSGVRWSSGIDFLEIDDR